MILVATPQGSPAWHRARAGVVTASCFDGILTRGGKPSRGDALLARIVAEILLGRPVETESSAFMERGKEMEPDAVAWFEWEKGVTTTEVGLCLRDDRRLGASPDRLVGDDAGLEIKCPSAAIHMANAIDPETFALDHRNQVQVGLWVTGRSHWWLVSFNPDLPKVALRIVPDAAWREAAEKALDAFLERLDAALVRFPPPPREEPTPFNDVPFPEEAFVNPEE